MFETVLVAARGPLALRVVRTCQRLGVRAVSVHSEADAGALHVVEADDAVLLGPAPPEDSYLDRRRVLEAARQCGASAVHPGGGALAKDAALARDVLDAGLGWIGAPPDLLDRLGAAPVGVHGGQVLAMHLLAGPEVVPLAVLETSPSVEEPLLAAAPAPGVADPSAVVELAVRAAADGGLRGVASAEVLVPSDGRARLRALRPWLPVEHPVSEPLTGHDLVEQQLRLAQGEAAARVPATPAERSALLLRVYAEPSTTERRLTAWREPSGVRVDSACRQGDAVLPWYDPLLATVTVAGASSDDVLARARAAVDGFIVDGVRTTLPRLAAVLADRSGSAA